MIERYHTVIVPVWFLERKSWLFTLVRSVIVPVLGPVHCGYAFVPFRSISRQKKQKKIWYVNKFQTLRIRSNFYLKFNKHERKWCRVLSSNLSNSAFFIRTNKCQQIKRDRHRENENMVEFSIQLQWQTRSPCIKSPKKFQKILAHKIPQAMTGFFSETLRKWMFVAFKFTRNRQNGLFRKDSATKAEREKVIWKLFNRCL